MDWPAGWTTTKEIATTISAIAGVAVALCSYRHTVAMATHNLKVSAMTKYLEHTKEGLRTVLLAFGKSKSVIEALRNYNSKIEKREDESFMAQTEINRQQKDIDEAYNEVVQAMCNDVGIEYNDYMIIQGFGKRSLENKWRNPL